MLWGLRSATTEKPQRTIKQDEILTVALVQIRAKGVCLACKTLWFITVQLTPSESIVMSLVQTLETSPGIMYKRGEIDLAYRLSLSLSITL